MKMGFDDISGKSVTKINYKQDYLTGQGIKPEDIWGHQLFDSIL